MEVLDPVATNNGSGSAPEMVHIFDVDNPGVTLCGKPVTKIVPDDTDVDCVVCEDLWKNWFDVFWD